MPIARSSPLPDEAFVVGSGPNGLAAAIVLAQAGLRVTVFEAALQPGGGASTAELTLPGFFHDLCSTAHPMAASSPFFNSLSLQAEGLQWVQPEFPLAHPFDDGSVALLCRSVDETAARLGPDRRAWHNTFGRLARDWHALAADLLGPIRLLPRHPLTLARFGVDALRPADRWARSQFCTPAARALFAGVAAHSLLPLDAHASTSFGLVLIAAAHSVGWPFARGGSAAITAALIARLRRHAGAVLTGHEVRSLRDFPAAGPALFDVTPRQLLAIAGDVLPGRYRRSLQEFRYGPGIFKMDWALDGPIPWLAPDCARAGTVHLGGELEEIAASEAAPWQGRTSARPFVILAQPTNFDPERAPAGRHIAWAYCHVPNGSEADMSGLIEAQIERFAPGFAARILARSALGPRQFELRNANLVGGDLGGGANILRQLLFRPTASLYRVPLPRLYLCSSSTPPGAGVHGMCGYHAARLALKDLRS
jgi:phytoene dehydrogenase-like protein